MGGMGSLSLVGYGGTYLRGHSSGGAGSRAGAFSSWGRQGLCWDVGSVLANDGVCAWGQFFGVSGAVLVVGAGSYGHLCRVQRMVGSVLGCLCQVTAGSVPGMLVQGTPGAAPRDLGWLLTGLIWG